MLRFDPGDDQISQTRRFRVSEGGGEYNVAQALRRCFGMRTAVVTALVDNPAGRLLEDLMLQSGVDLSNVQWLKFDGVGRTARNGIYFLERGYGRRGAVGVMDRGNTAISQMQPGQVDWGRIFGVEGVRWIHTGGIMCGLGQNTTDVVFEAMEAARRHGVLISYDCNYRPSLWQSRGGIQTARDVNRRVAPMIDVLLGHDGDLASESTEAAQEPVRHDATSYASMAQRITGEFPNIKVIATTMRQATTATRNGWSAFAWDGQTAYQSLDFPNLEIFDRVGGGDGFAAGLFYGLLEKKGMQWALDCAVAHGAHAMTTPGDNSTATLSEVEQLISEASFRIQR